MGDEQQPLPLRKMSMSGSVPNLSSGSPSGGPGLRQRAASGDLHGLSLGECREELSRYKKDNFNLKLKIHALEKLYPQLQGKDSHEMMERMVELEEAASAAEEVAEAKAAALAEFVPEFTRLQEELGRLETEKGAAEGRAEELEGRLEEQEELISELRDAAATAAALSDPPSASEDMRQRDLEMEKLRAALAEKEEASKQAVEQLQVTIREMEEALAEKEAELKAAQEAAALAHADEIDFSRVDAAEAAAEESMRKMAEILSQSQSPAEAKTDELEALELSIQLKELKDQVAEKSAKLAEMAKESGKQNRLILTLSRTNKVLSTSLRSVSNLASPGPSDSPALRRPAAATRTPQEMMRLRYAERYVEAQAGDGTPPRLLLHESVAELTSPAGVLNTSIQAGLAELSSLRVRSVTLKDACRVLYDKLRGSSAFLRTLVEKYGGPEALRELEKFVSLEDLDLSMEATQAFIGQVEGAESSVWELTEQMNDLLLAGDGSSHFHTLPLGGADGSMTSTGVGATPRGQASIGVGGTPGQLSIAGDSTHYMGLPVPGDASPDSRTQDEFLVRAAAPCERCPELATRLSEAEDRLAQLQDASEELSRVETLFSELVGEQATADAAFEAQMGQKNAELAEASAAQAQLSAAFQQAKAELRDLDKELTHKFAEAEARALEAADAKLQDKAVEMEKMAKLLSSAESRLEEMQTEDQAKAVEVETLREKAAESAAGLRALDESARKAEAHWKRELSRAASEVERLRADYEAGAVELRRMEDVEGRQNEELARLREYAANSRPVRDARNVGLNTELDHWRMAELASAEKTVAVAQRRLAEIRGADGDAQFLRDQVDEVTRQLHENNLQLASALDAEERLAAEATQSREEVQRLSAALKAAEVKAKTHSAHSVHSDADAEDKENGAGIRELQASLEKERHNGRKMQQMIQRLMADKKAAEDKAMKPETLEAIGSEMKNIHSTLQSVLDSTSSKKRGEALKPTKEANKK